MAAVPRKERYGDLISAIESLLDKNDREQLIAETQALDKTQVDDFLEKRKAILEDYKKTLERYKKRYQTMPGKIADIKIFQEDLDSYITLIESVRMHYRHEVSRVALEGPSYDENIIKKNIPPLADDTPIEKLNKAIGDLKTLEANLNTIINRLKLREDAVKEKIPFYQRNASNPEIIEIRRLENIAKTHLKNIENIRAPYEMAKAKIKQEEQLAERVEEREKDRLTTREWHFEAGNVWGQAAKNFWNGLWVDFVTPAEARELHRKQADLDRLFKEGVLEGDKVTLRYAAENVKDLALDVVSAIKDFTQETVTRAWDSVKFIFTAPFMVPMKLTHVVAKGTERVLFASGFAAQAFREWGMKQMDTFAKNPSITKGLMAGVGLIATVVGGAAELAFKIPGTIAKGVRYAADYDKWTKKAPILEWGFVALGATLFIAASIATLGFFPAIVGTGLAIAAGVSAASGAIYALFKARKNRPKKTDLSTLRLSDDEELQLGLQEKMWGKRKGATQEATPQKLLQSTAHTASNEIAVESEAGVKKAPKIKGNRFYEAFLSIFSGKKEQAAPGEKAPGASAAEIPTVVGRADSKRLDETAAHSPAELKTLQENAAKVEVKRSADSVASAEQQPTSKAPVVSQASVQSGRSVTEIGQDLVNVAAHRLESALPGSGREFIPTQAQRKGSSNLGLRQRNKPKITISVQNDEPSPAGASPKPQERSPSPAAPTSTAGVSEGPAPDSPRRPKPKTE